MPINDIFKPKHPDLISEINTQLSQATVTHTIVTCTAKTFTAKTCTAVPSTTGPFTAGPITKSSITSLELDDSLPTLYYFEISSSSSYSNADLVDIFNIYRTKNKATKALTAVRNPMPTCLSGSKCLYAGKVRKNINARLEIHFGVGGSIKTAGLRLNDWLPSGVILTLHIYQIDGLADVFLVDLLEEYLKEMHEPILGIK